MFSLASRKHFISGSNLFDSNSSNKFYLIFIIVLNVDIECFTELSFKSNTLINNLEFNFFKAGHFVYVLFSSSERNTERSKHCKRVRVKA